MKNILKPVVAVACLVLVAACGSTSGGSDDGGSSSAWKGSTPLKQGKVGVLNVLGSSENQAHWGNTTSKALKAIGWTEVNVDGKGDPAIEGQAINSFVQQQVDAILIIGGIAVPTIAAQLRQAKSAKIPVLTTGVTSPNEDDLLTGVFAPADSEFGTRIAPYLIKKLPKGAPYVALDLTAAAGAQAPNIAVKPLLEAAGHKRAGGIDLDLSGDLASQAAKGTGDLLTANPDAKLLFGCCDFTSPVTDPVLRQSGHKDVMQSVRYDNLSTLQLIRKGSNVVTQAVNSDGGPLYALGQIVANKSKGSKIASGAPDTLWKWTVVDKSNLPDEGKFFYDPDAQINAWVKSLQSEYSR
jgi:ABC-type sugar transport system substrate-binding protein